MNHKEMTKHIRGRLKASKIEARCRLYTACGANFIHVFPARSDTSWNGAQARTIATIAKVNELTYVRGMAIDDTAERWDNSGATNFHFQFNG